MYQISPREMSSYCPKWGQRMRITENIDLLSTISQRFLYIIKIVSEITLIIPTYALT